MFDITSSKLLILGIVALIVVGPRELPMLLRTLGKYIGIVRKQANEFRAQFDEAMRESELVDLKKDIEGVGREMETTMREAELSVEREVSAANAEMDGALTDTHAAPAAETPAETTLRDAMIADAAAPEPAAAPRSAPAPVVAEPAKAQV